MSDLDKFLESLTTEQLESLLVIKKNEQKEISTESPPVTKKSKRKQSRSKSPSETPHNRPTKRRKAQPEKIKNKGKSARCLGPPELGPRPNRFSTGDLKDVKNTSKEETAIDKVLWKGKTPTQRLVRHTTYVTAVCSGCEYEFDNVKPELCIHLDGQYWFRCDDCTKGDRS